MWSDRENQELPFHTDKPRVRARTETINARPFAVGTMPAFLKWSAVALEGLILLLAHQSLWARLAYRRAIAPRYGVEIRRRPLTGPHQPRVANPRPPEGVSPEDVSRTGAGNDAGRIGIEFLSLVPEEWTHLQHTVTQLELHPYEKKPTDDTSEAA